LSVPFAPLTRKSWAHVSQASSVAADPAMVRTRFGSSRAAALHRIAHLPGLIRDFGRLKLNAPILVTPLQAASRVLSSIEKRKLWQVECFPAAAFGAATAERLARSTESFVERWIGSLLVDESSGNESSEEKRPRELDSRDLGVLEPHRRHRGDDLGRLSGQEASDEIHEWLAHGVGHDVERDVRIVDLAELLLRHMVRPHLRGRDRRTEDLRPRGRSPFRRGPRRCRSSRSGTALLLFVGADRRETPTIKQNAKTTRPFLDMSLAPFLEVVR